MFIQPFDASLDEAEWRDWIAAGGKFGVLAVAGGIDVSGPSVDAGSAAAPAAPAASAPAPAAPVMIPTHFTLLQDQILIHLARPNKVLPLLETGNPVSLLVTGDYAYVPNQWRARPDAPVEDGVPTSYYAAVNFVCKPSVLKTPEEIAAVLRQQMADFQPEGGYSPVDAHEGYYASMMSGIRAVSLQILSVEAKFKYDDHKSVEFRERMIERLEERDLPLDAGAAAEQRRRLERIGEWKEFRHL